MFYIHRVRNLYSKPLLLIGGIYIFVKTSEYSGMGNDRHMLVQKLKKENAFWSYDNAAIDLISDDELIEKVLIHLDIEEIFALFRMFPKRKIQKVWQERMLSQEPMFHGLNRLYAFLLFDIKNPDRYIRDFKNRRYKALICKV